MRFESLIGYGDGRASKDGWNNAGSFHKRNSEYAVLRGLPRMSTVKGNVDCAV